MDVQTVKNSTKNPDVVFANMKYKDNPTAENLFGYVTVKNDKSDKILRSWAIDFENDRLEEVNKKKVELVYDFFGYDG